MIILQPATGVESRCFVFIMSIRKWRNYPLLAGLTIIHNNSSSIYLSVYGFMHESAYMAADDVLMDEEGGVT